MNWRNGLLRKVILPILTVICICGCVLSCSAVGDDTDICEVLLRVCEIEDSYSSDMAVFYFDETRKCENGDFQVLSREKFGYLYDGKFEEPVCFGRISGYAIRMPLDTSGYEVHIVECVNASDSKEIEAMLLRRVEKMQSAEILQYAPESYEICFRGAIVYSYGRYVFLLATPDNEAAIKEIKRLL